MEIPNSQTLGLAAIAILDIVAIGRLLLRAHGFEGGLSWILGILAFPGIGAIAYLTLASPRIVSATRRIQKIVPPRRAGAGPEPFGTETSPSHALERLASTLTALPSTSGNRVDLMIEDEAAFDRIEAAIIDATESVWAEYYIVCNDETGRRFLDLLTRKAQQGKQVHLIFDAVGSAGIDSNRLNALRAAGGRAEAFLPMNPLRRRWAVNLRNHRKMIIVDGRLAFTGGMNVGDQYSGRSRLKGEQSFHDTHLCVQGPAVMHLALIFAEDWAFATEELLPRPKPESPAPSQGPATVSIVPSGPDQEWNASRLLFFTGLGGASSRAWISSPYFIPDQATRMSLKAAALRGVDVRVLIPSRCDVWIVGLAVRALLEELLIAGVRIYEFLPAMLHAKTLVIDDEWGLVGSANVDMRSFRYNFELGALVRDKDLAQALEDRFLEDLSQSREILLEDCRRRGLFVRGLHGAASLLSPLL
ncbi:MAG: cardiolipin synthase [Planctomycetota bacterium]